MVLPKQFLDALEAAGPIGPDQPKTSLTEAEKADLENTARCLRSVLAKIENAVAPLSYAADLMEMVNYALQSAIKLGAYGYRTNFLDRRIKAEIAQNARKGRAVTPREAALKDAVEAELAAIGSPRVRPKKLSESIADGVNARLKDGGFKTVSAKTIERRLSSKAKLSGTF